MKSDGKIRKLGGNRRIVSKQRRMPGVIEKHIPRTVWRFR